MRGCAAAAACTVALITATATSTAVIAAEAISKAAAAVVVVAAKSGDVIARHRGVAPPPKLARLQAKPKMEVLRAQFFHRMELNSVEAAEGMPATHARRAGSEFNAAFKIPG